VGMGVSPGVAQQLSAAGISGFKGEREKEKLEMRNLNERLANYIEKVHFLSAENQRLEAENEALRNRKSEDLQPIRDAYENELDQARKVIDELSVREGVEKAKLQSLNDEIVRQREIISTYENQAADYRNKMSMLESQVGDLEAELASLRSRLGSRDDEAEKMRALISKYQEQLRNMREDLDAATVAHIEAECMAQTKTEEAAFYRDLLDQLELMKPEPIKIKGMDAAEFWQSHMKKAIRDIQNACDEKVGMIQADCEAKFNSQVNAIKAGSVKDNVQLVRSTEEVTKLRSQLSELKNANAQLTQKCALLQSERDQMSAQLSSMETEMDEMRCRFEKQINGLEAELAAVMEQLRVLMDSKLSMELEIAMYKKLLEGEETRSSFRNMLECGSFVNGSLAAALNQQQTQQVPIQQEQMGLQQMTATFALPSTSTTSSSHVEGRKIQKWNKGSVCFGNIDHSAGCVTLENEGGHPQAKNTNLGGWRVQKRVNNQVQAEVVLKDYNLVPGDNFVMWSRGSVAGVSSANEMLSENFTVGEQNCVWILVDHTGDERASLTETFI